VSGLQPRQPKVEEEEVIICEKCGKELGFVLYFKKVEHKCPTCADEASPDTCWLLCHNCRGLSV
jgi:rubrerythrin